MRLNAYYYSFKSTGVVEIDRILSAVASAGKSFHHTENWNEKLDWEHPDFKGVTCAEWIQNAANEAAEKFKVNP